jgi:hypothetical protein
MLHPIYEIVFTCPFDRLGLEKTGISSIYNLNLVFDQFWLHLSVLYIYHFIRAYATFLLRDSVVVILLADLFVLLSVVSDSLLSRAFGRSASWRLLGIWMVNN